MPCPWSMPYLDLGTLPVPYLGTIPVLSHQGIFSSLQAGNKPRELSERLTNWTGSLRGQGSSRVGKGTVKTMSTWWQWCQPLDGSEMLDQLRKAVKAVFGRNVWMLSNGEAQPDVITFFQGRRGWINLTQQARTRMHFPAWHLLLALLC